MTRHVALIVELVNLSTTVSRGGSPSLRLDHAQLAAAFVEELSPTMAGRVGDVLDAGARLTRLAAQLRAAIVAPDPAATAARVNAMIERYGAQPRLVDDVGQPFHLHFQGAGETVVESLGGEFATALALIVDRYGPQRLGQCQAHRCDAVYVDTTRNGSRRYCSSSCTARAKTAAYRSRRHA
jgi:predicted RNA-binding Zn ribbon-like protein